MSVQSFTEAAGVTDAVRLVVGSGIPAASLTVSAGLPSLVSAALALVAPAGQQVVPTATPVFTVAVTTSSLGATVQVQVSGDAAFTSPVVASGDAAAGLDAVHATARLDAPLTDESTYWWRARLVTGSGVSGWTGAQQFAVNTPDGMAVAPGGWNVVAGLVAPPHLWHLGPDTGTSADDDAVMVGTGFGAHPRLLLVGTDISARIAGVSDIPADTSGSASGIDPAGAITPAHQQILFTIPDLGDESGGGVITVEYGG